MSYNKTINDFQFDEILVSTSLKVINCIILHVGTNKSTCRTCLNYEVQDPMLLSLKLAVCCFVYILEQPKHGAQLGAINCSNWLKADPEYRNTAFIPILHFTITVGSVIVSITLTIK